MSARQPFINILIAARSLSKLRRHIHFRIYLCRKTLPLSGTNMPMSFSRPLLKFCQKTSPICKTINTMNMVRVFFLSLPRFFWKRWQKKGLTHRKPFAFIKPFPIYRLQPPFRNGANKAYPEIQKQFMRLFIVLLRVSSRENFPISKRCWKIMPALQLSTRIGSYSPFLSPLH